VKGMTKQTPRWFDSHPTLSEMEKMLLKAGIPTNPREWTAEQVEKAADILNGSRAA